jgi:hypothetical protein
MLQCPTIVPRLSSYWTRRRNRPQIVPTNAWQGTCDSVLLLALFGNGRLEFYPALFVISNGFHELELKNQRTVPAAVADTPSMEVESYRNGSDLFIRSNGQLHTANGGVYFVPQGCLTLAGDSFTSLPLSQSRRGVSPQRSARRDRRTPAFSLSFAPDCRGGRNP